VVLCYLRKGATTSEITEACSDNDLAVLGAGGSASMTRAPMDKVVEAIIHHMPCPVRVVKAPRRA
jgi:nucleotide-binding universal stress UspA family protein